MTTKNVTIYSTPTCHFCHAAKAFFDEHSVAYQDFNVATDMEKRKEMVDMTGQMGVPVIRVENDVIVGFDEAKLRELLAIV
jgi:glutaredoxin 3